MALGIALLGPRDPRAEPTRDEIRASMRKLFESLRMLLPLSVDEGAFRAAENRERVHAALQSLGAGADVLATHASAGETGFGFLGGHLAHDAGEILRSYEQGQLARSQFLLRQLTEYCVTCHARLPSPGDSPVAEDFVADTVLARLPAEERATLFIATRRFDEALTTLEKLFANSALHPAEMLGPLTDYLIVSIRVKRDLARPAPVLRRFARRPDLWRHLRMDVERWIVDLQRFQKQDLESSDLAYARALIDEAKRMILFPGDRAALVHYVVASSVLHGYVEAHASEADAKLAEAYYLLGLLESRIGRDYWVSAAGVYLETAVRLAPREPFAERAYALLEEEIVLGWSGTAGINVPEDLERRLAELRRLIDAP
jgi:hypothetical protein